MVCSSCYFELSFQNFCRPQHQEVDLEGTDSVQAVPRRASDFAQRVFATQVTGRKACARKANRSHHYHYQQPQSKHTTTATSTIKGHMRLSAGERDAGGVDVRGIVDAAVWRLGWCSHGPARLPNEFASEWPRCDFEH